MLNSIIIIAVLVIVGLFIYGLIKSKSFASFFKVFGKVLGVVAIIGLIFSGIYSYNVVNTYYTSSGGIYGTISSILYNTTTTSSDNGTITFSFNNIVMKQGDDGYYYCVFTKSYDDDDYRLQFDSDSYYGIFVYNNQTEQQCNYVSYNSDWIEAEYSYAFFNEDHEAIGDDTLTFKFAFYDNYCYLKITSAYVDGSNSTNLAELWNAYFNKYNFTVIIKEVENIYSYSSIGSSIVTFINCDETYDIIILENETYLQNVSSPELEGYTFLGWSTDETAENIVDLENYKISKDTTFYAIYEINTYIVTFYSDDSTTLTTLALDYGTTIESVSYDTEIGYEFDGWIDDDGEELDFETYTVSSDANFYAKVSPVAVIWNYDYSKIEMYWDEFINDDYFTLTETTLSAGTNKWVLSRINIVLPSGITTIASNAFSQIRYTIESLTLPDTVTTICEYAFDDCNLLEIILPSTLTEIGDYAFANAEIETIELPSTLTNIGDYAFYSCASLQGITIPENVKTIGYGAFSNCNKLSTIELNDGVESIGDYAFYYCTKLSSVTMPGSITKIGDYAFYYCTKLSSVTMSGSITEIGDYAFYSCTSITKSTLHSMLSNLSVIGDYAFYGLKISIITLPDNIKKIGAYSFTSNWLSKIYVPEGITLSDDAFGDCDYLTIYTEYSSTPSIWSSNWNSANCTVIWNYSIFVSDTDYCGLYDENMNLIYNWNYLTYNEYIEVTDLSITDFYLHNYIDYDEYEIITLCIPAEIESINLPVLYGASISDILENQTYFLTNIIFQDGSQCTSISGSSFIYHCIRINSIDFGNDSILENIGSKIFEYSTMTSIYLPENLTTIGTYAFQHCENLESFNFENTQIESINYGVFYGCSSLKQVWLSSKISSIDPTAFNDCSQLEFIEIRDNETYYSYNNLLIESETMTIVLGGLNAELFEGVITIGEYAFYGRYSGTLEIPSGVTTIESLAFSYCTFDEIIISETVTSIAYGVDSDYSILNSFFYVCVDTITVDSSNEYYTVEGNSLIEIKTMTLVLAGSNAEIAEDVLIIGTAAFSGNSLTYIIIPENINEIQDNAFYGCKSLAYIYLPSSVESIGRSIFFLAANSGYVSNGSYSSYTISWTIIVGTDYESIDDIPSSWIYYDGTTVLKNSELSSTADNYGLYVFNVTSEEFLALINEEG